MHQAYQRMEGRLNSKKHGSADHRRKDATNRLLAASRR